MDINCPNCGNNLVEIIYGIPTSEIIEKVNNKELYIGGCEELDNSLKYHCYFCNRNYYDNLKDYVEDKRYFYVYVEYLENPGDKLYCYKSENREIEKGDIVLIDRSGEKVYGKVITIKEYTSDNAPYPPFLTKDILVVDKTDIKKVEKLSS